ncbi:MAG: NBR1-Ig-like domain-containing protein [Gemmatimonadales bacterium]
MPTSLLPGQTQHVFIIMRNTGSTTWTRAGEYKLGSQHPQDNVRWGTNRVYLEPGDATAPGQTKTFEFEITAPTTPGTYDFQWRMVQDGVEWFGAQTPNVRIAVQPPARANDADFSGGLLPPLLEPGETRHVSLTWRNTGTTTWTRADEYKLGSQNPQDNVRWGTNRVYLEPGDSILPGQNKTFTFDITAPTSLGTYDVQWRMVQDGVEWFGDTMPTFRITVQGPTAEFVT